MPSSTTNKLYKLEKKVIRSTEGRPHYYKLSYSEDALIDGVYNIFEEKISTTSISSYKQQDNKMTLE